MTFFFLFNNTWHCYTLVKILLIELKVGIAKNRTQFEDKCLASFQWFKLSCRSLVVFNKKV